MSEYITVEGYGSVIYRLQEENTNLHSDISHLNAEITSLNEQLAYMRDMLDKVEAANYHERLREAIQAERKRWAKEDAEALRVRDIEQQKKALDWVARNIDIYGAGYGELSERIEQLRKELEK